MNSEPNRETNQSCERFLTACSLTYLPDSPKTFAISGRKAAIRVPLTADFQYGMMRADQPFPFDRASRWRN
jgi:hypothetical protein